MPTEKNLKFNHFINSIYFDMKQILYFFSTMALFLIAFSATAQVNIFVSPDSMHVTKSAEEFDIEMLAQISNYSGGPVIIRWTRVIEQKPQEWDVNFCDKNLCYLGSVSTRTFEMADAESGMLKPIFYPNSVPGTGVFRLYLQSETPGVTWADTVVYVAVATGLSGAIEAELVRNVAVYPNPASDILNVVTADANLQGRWRITDAMGKVWGCSNPATTAIAGQIQVAQIPAGIYFLNVLTPDGRHAAAKRFAVQR